MVLNTIHNLRYYLRLMERIREAIREGRYLGFRDRFLRERNAIDNDDCSEAKIG